MNKTIFAQLGDCFCRAYDIQKDTLIKIYRAPDQFTLDYWENVWAFEMNSTIGDITTVIADDMYGIATNEWYYPWTCVKVVHD